MEGQKPKSINNIGLTISIFGGFIIFSNVMGTIVHSFLSSFEEINDQPAEMENAGMSGLSFLYEHYIAVCIIMVSIGALFLLGGIFLRKYKMWANRLVSIISGLIFVGIWSLMITMYSMTINQEGLLIFSVGAIMTAIFWSAPLAVLIWFLNKKKIKVYFA